MIVPGPYEMGQATVIGTSTRCRMMFITQVGYGGGKLDERHSCLETSALLRARTAMAVSS